MTRTLWLSCHVDYACRHSGACCRAGWPLPVESRVAAAIDAAVSEGRVRLVDGGVVWLAESAEAPDDVAGTLRQVGGGCVFHTAADPPGAGGGRRCAVHASLGHAALPSTCQHFPRVCVIDARAVRVSLSHQCPTAAALLVDHVGPVTVVHGPSAVPGLETPEGLDVRGELPPRLSDTVLMDAEGYEAWEQHVVETLAGARAADDTPEEALARLVADARRLRTWTPGAHSLSTAVASLEAARRDVEVTDALSGIDDPEAWAADVRRVAATCRPPWTWAPPSPGPAGAARRGDASAWGGQAPAVRRYLAARAFAAWPAYQVDATLGLAAWLRTCLSVLRVECAEACAAAGRALDRELLLEAIGRADLLLLHYADSLAWARALGS